MARKMRSPVMFRRAWKLMVVSPMGKVVKPITTTIGLDRRSKLVFLFNKPLERFKLLKHRDKYSHHYEHEFSPGSSTSTPLFRWDRKSGPFKKKKRMFSFLLCGGGSGMDEVSFGDVSPEINVLDGDEEAEEEEASAVDRRAEEFIQWFYEEMRSQN